MEQQAAERTGHERERLGKPVAPGQMKLNLTTIKIENWKYMNVSSGRNLVGIETGRDTVDEHTSKLLYIEINEALKSINQFVVRSFSSISARLTYQIQLCT